MQLKSSVLNTNPTLKKYNIHLILYTIFPMRIKLKKNCSRSITKIKKNIFHFESKVCFGASSLSSVERTSQSASVCVCFLFRFIFVLHIIGGNMRYTRSELNDALAGFRPHHPQHEQHKMLQQIERKCYICQRFGFFFLTKPISWIIIKNWKKRNDIRIYKAYMDNSICYMLQNFRAIAAQNDVLSKHLLVSFSFFFFIFFLSFLSNERMNEWLNESSMLFPHMHAKRAWLQKTVPKFKTSNYWFVRGSALSSFLLCSECWPRCCSEKKNPIRHASYIECWLPKVHVFVV